MKGYNTAIYDNLPVSVIIYEVIHDEAGEIADYRIVYGNRTFARDYRSAYRREDYLGALAVRDRLIDDYTLFQMKSFTTGKPKAFSTFVPHANLHVHMEPLTDLPEGYVGYFISNISDFDEQESRVHFLHAIRQMDDAAKAAIPIIAVTANAFEEDRKLAIEAGMDRHLAKPYDIPKMLETLGELLGPGTQTDKGGQTRCRKDT